MEPEEKRPRKSKRWVRLVVIGVLVLYAIALIPPYERARESARRASCKNNLKQIGLALHIYSTDHDDNFPQGETAADVFIQLIEGGYLKDEPMGTYDRYPVYVCPSARDDVKAWKRTRKLTEETCSYEWVAGLSAKSPPDFALVFDKAGNHRWGGGNVLYVDGHVSWYREEGFQEQMVWQREMGKRIEEGGKYMPFEESAGRATCKKHLKETARALRAYASEHDGEFPPGETAVEVFGELIEEGLLDHKSWLPVYVCPSARGDVARWSRNRKLAENMCSYEWVPGLSTESPPDFVLLFDKAGNHDGEGRNVLYVDRHVSWIGEEGFQERMEWQREMRRRIEEGGEYVGWDEWREGKGGGDDVP